jgi:hypothetical protein
MKGAKGQVPAAGWSGFGLLQTIITPAVAILTRCGGGQEVVSVSRTGIVESVSRNDGY